MPENRGQLSAHQLVHLIEEHHRPGGAWTYDADPSWSREGTIVFAERILLRVAQAQDAHGLPAGYDWSIEAWDPGDETYRSTTGGHAPDKEAMIEVATRFIDEHNIGEPLPLTVYPLAAELVERVRTGYPRAQWRSYTNDVFGSVLEYPEHRRLTFWDEANFMGSIDGYTWQVETFSPHEQRWEVTASNHGQVISLTELREVIADFHAICDPGPAHRGATEDVRFVSSAPNLAVLQNQLRERERHLDPASGMRDPGGPPTGREPPRTSFAGSITPTRQTRSVERTCDGEPRTGRGPTRQGAPMSLILETLALAPTVLPAQIDINPNDSGLPGISALRTIVGAVMTIGLILSVLALIISAVVWGFGANSSNPHLAGRGKVGVLISCAAAIITGASVTLINFFWNVGQTVS